MTESTPRSARMRRLFAPFTDPRRLPHIAAVSVLCGALAYRNPATQKTSGRLGIRVGTAALTGFVTWVGLRDLQDDFFRRPLRAGLTASAVGTALALGEVSDVIDGKLHRGLVRRGVAHPRLVLAGASAALMALASLPGRRTVTPAPTDDDASEEAVAVEIPADVRRLVEALLASSESWGAPELRAQLAAAKALEYRGEDEEAFYPGIGFTVPAALARAVPHDARFPIVGRYHPLDGRSADVYLTIADGRIAHLSIAAGADWTLDEEVAWMDAGGSVQDISQWPAPEELTLLVETAEGLRPL